MIKTKDRLFAVFFSAEGEIWTPDQGLMSPLDKDSGKLPFELSRIQIPEQF